MCIQTRGRLCPSCELCPMGKALPFSHVCSLGSLTWLCCVNKTHLPGAWTVLLYIHLGLPLTRQNRDSWQLQSQKGRAGESYIPTDFPKLFKEKVTELTPVSSQVLSQFAFWWPVGKDCQWPLETLLWIRNLYRHYLLDVHTLCERYSQRLYKLWRHDYSLNHSNLKTFFGIYFKNCFGDYS